MLAGCITLLSDCQWGNHFFKTNFLYGLAVDLKNTKCLFIFR